MVIVLLFFVVGTVGVALMAWSALDQARERERYNQRLTRLAQEYVDASMAQRAADIARMDLIYTRDGRARGAIIYRQREESQ